VQNNRVKPVGQVFQATFRDTLHDATHFQQLKRMHMITQHLATSKDSKKMRVVTTYSAKTTRQAPKMHFFEVKKIKYLQEPDSLAQCGCISLNGMLGDMFVQSLVGHVSREGLRMSENASQISGSAPVATPVWRGSSTNTSILTAPTHSPWSKIYIRVVGVSVVALQSGLVAAQMVWNRYSHACWGSWGRNFVKFGRNFGFLRFFRCQCVRVW
jgi:hypothetical protein